MKECSADIANGIGWGCDYLHSIKPVLVEAWLRSLPVADGSKANIRNIMSAVFSHGIRYELTDKNPIKAVRQSGGRAKVSMLLDVWEIMLLAISGDTTDLQICRLFDKDGIVDLPENWKTGNNRSFEIAYKERQHRPKIEKMISKVRTDLRNIGILK